MEKFQLSSEKKLAPLLILLYPPCTCNVCFSVLGWLFILFPPHYCTMYSVSSLNSFTASTTSSSSRKHQRETDSSSSDLDDYTHLLTALAEEQPDGDPSTPSLSLSPTESETVAPARKKYKLSDAARQRRNERRRSIRPLLAATAPSSLSPSPLSLLMRRDIRRDYLTMLANSFNSSDLSLIRRFLDTHCVAHFEYWDQSPESVKMRMAPLVHVRGTDQLLHCIRENFLCLPDCVVRIHGDAMLKSRYLLHRHIVSESEDGKGKVIERETRWSEPIDSFVIASCSFEGTVVCEPRPEHDWSDSAKKTFQSRYISLPALESESDRSERDELMPDIEKVQLAHPPMQVRIGGYIAIGMDTESRITKLHFFTDSARETNQYLNGLLL